MSVRIALGGAAQEAVGRVLPRLVDEKVASGITAQDPTLWGADAERHATRRLGWTGAVAAARPLLPEVAALRAQLHGSGARRIVVCSGGGAAKAAACLARSMGAELTVIESTDPVRVRAAFGNLQDAAVVLAQPSGAPYDVGPQRRTVEQAYTELGIDPAGRLVVVAAAGSGLAEAAGRSSQHWIETDPLVGDRFSALTAAVLVPAGLAGVDIAEVLDEAESEELNLAIDDAANNGLRLGAALGGARRGLLAIVADGSHLVGFDAWAEHLLAGSGLLPVVLEADAPELAGPALDLQVLRLVDDAHAGTGPGENEILLSGSLGELLLLLQYATVVTARLLGADPFDAEPDAPVTPTDPAFVADGVEVRRPAGLAATDLRSAVDDLVAAAVNHRLVLHVTGDPQSIPGLAAIRAALADRVGHPVPLLTGPAAVLAGGAPVSVVQLTADPPDDGELTRMAAASAAAAYTARGARVLDLRLVTPEAAEAVLAAVTAREAAE